MKIKNPYGWALIADIWCGGIAGAIWSLPASLVIAFILTGLFLVYATFVRMIDNL